MIVHIYDEITKEYLFSQECDKDPEESLIQNKFVPLVPAFGTLLEPLEPKKGKVVVFQDGWKYINDYRGVKVINPETEETDIVNYIGELKEGFIEYSKYIRTKEYKEKKEQQNLERIAKLSMTKLDFFNLICKPNNITYKQLNELINSNDDLAAEWNLCERVYRGNSTLIEMVKKYTKLTESKLTEIFESVKD